MRIKCPQSTPIRRTGEEGLCGTETKTREQKDMQIRSTEFHSFWSLWIQDSGPGVRLSHPLIMCLGEDDGPPDVWCGAIYAFTYSLHNECTTDLCINGSCVRTKKGKRIRIVDFNQQEDNKKPWTIVSTLCPEGELFWTLLNCSEAETPCCDFKWLHKH